MEPAVPPQPTTSQVAPLEESSQLSRRGFLRAAGAVSPTGVPGREAQPWDLHGYPMKHIARDGCDQAHVEGQDGMFGMAGMLFMVSTPDHIAAMLNLLTAQAPQAMAFMATRTGRAVGQEPDPSTGTTGQQGSHLKKLLLATDLTETSASATDEAFELATRLDASLLVVSVIDPGSLLMPGGRFRVRVDQVRAQREKQAQELVERGRAAGVVVSFLIWTGDPGDLIVEAAEAERADMILVGSHGRGAVGRLLLGSVSEHVVRNAPCPVLVVRPREAPVN